MTAPAGGSRADAPLLAGRCPHCRGPLERVGDARGWPVDRCQDPQCCYAEAVLTDEGLASLLSSPTWPAEVDPCAHATWQTAVGPVCARCGERMAPDDANPLIHIAGRTPERCERDVRVLVYVAWLALAAGLVGLGYLWGAM